MMVDMKNEKAQLTHNVVCSWCGCTVRRDSIKPSEGMCKACYHAMLRRHGCLNQPVFVRERIDTSVCS